MRLIYGIVAITWAIVGALHIGGIGSHHDPVSGAMFISGAYFLLMLPEVCENGSMRS